MAPKAAAKKFDGELVEKVKKILLLKGRTSSQVMNDVLKDLALISKPNAKALQRKNDIIPFEDAHSLEFLGPRNECGLFALASHSKKRPDNLTIGRLYEGHILDMYEFGVSNFESIHSIPGSKKAFGSKPLLVFLGDQWQTDSTYSKIENLLLDLFRGFKADKLSIEGVDHLITCATADGVIYVRSFYINYKKTPGSNTPELVLKPMGPNLDLSVRRTQLASEDMWKVACKRPRLPEQIKVKNVKENILGDKIGRIHMKKQNLDAIGGKRVKALRNAGKRERGDGAIDVDELANKKRRS